MFPLQLPPLRERSGDVPLLVKFLVDKFGTRVGRRIDAIEPATLEWLTSYHWPGNVRELENVLERALILSNGPTLEIDPEVFSAAPPPSTAPLLAPTTATSMESMERNHILAVLSQTDWVIEGPRGAAKILELHPNTLRSRMKKLGIRKGDK